MVEKFKPFKSFNRSAQNGLNVLNLLNDLNRLFSRFGEQLLHLTHGLFDSDDYRAGDNAVADIELDNFGNGGDGRNIIVIESVTAVNFQAEAPSQRSRASHGVALLLPTRSGCITVISGMNLHGVSPNRLASFDLPCFGIDEQTHVNATFLKAPDCLQHLLPIPYDIEAAFGGEFLSLFRHETRVMRSQPIREVNHRWSHSHFQVELCF
jgi:hypothetical protein